MNVREIVDDCLASGMSWSQAMSEARRLKNQEPNTEGIKRIRRSRKILSHDDEPYTYNSVDKSSQLW